MSDLPQIITRRCSLLAPWGLHLAVRGRRHFSKRTFQVLQAPIYQDKIIHYLIRWEMSPCAYAHVCMCGSECSDVVRKQGEKQTSDVRQSNEAARQRLSKLEGENSSIRLISFGSFPPVLQGKVTMKQGSVRPSVCRRVPLISCLDHPLQASPSTGQRWLGGDESRKYADWQWKIPLGL